MEFGAFGCSVVNMLPRIHRLTIKKDFVRVACARPFHALHFTMRAIPNGLPVTRIGIVTGLKVSKRATKRNRIKRIIRDVFQRHFPSLHTGADIVIHAKSTAVGVSYKDLSNEIGNVLNKAKVLQSPWVDTLGETKKSKKPT